jgi:hypothetical protein
MSYSRKSSQAAPEMRGGRPAGAASALCPAAHRVGAVGRSESVAAWWVHRAGAYELPVEDQRLRGLHVQPALLGARVARKGLRGRGS